MEIHAQNPLLQIQSNLKELENGFRRSMIASKLEDLQIGFRRSMIASKLEDLQIGFRRSMIASKLEDLQIGFRRSMIASKLEDLQIGFRRSMVPLHQFGSKFVEFGHEIDYWASQQPLYIDAAASTVRGAVFGGIADQLECLVHFVFQYQAGHPHRWGVYYATSSGISAVSLRLNGVKRVKGETRETTMVAIFGSLAMRCLVDGDHSGAIIALVLALCTGGVYKALQLIKKFDKKKIHPT